MAETELWAYHRTNHFRKERTGFIPPKVGRDEVVRLNLGCGEKRLRGYINVDLYGTPDEYHDFTKLPYPENSVDEILGVHILEHIFISKIEETLKNWYKVLKTGGRLILEMPDLKKILGFFQKDDPNLFKTMYALYGKEVGSGRVEDVHKWCWTFATLKPILEHIGFKDITEKPAKYHMLERDFRVEAVK